MVLNAGTSFKLVNDHAVFKNGIDAGFLGKLT